MHLPDPPAADLSPTGRVILGMIALGRSTGYDIKSFVDRTTRYFWAASYGQIYPELKRLEDRGLVRGRPDPAGIRARFRLRQPPRGQPLARREPGHVPPALRLRAGLVAVLAFGLLATLGSGEFRISWAFLGLDVLLVALAAVAGFAVMHRLRWARPRSRDGGSGLA